MEPILERRSVRLTLLIVIALAFLVFVYLLRDIFAPLVTGFLLAYMLDPLADFLERRRFSRAAAVATIYLVAAVLAATVFFFGSFYVASGVYSAVNKIRGDRLFEHVDLTKIQDLKPKRHFEDRDGDGRYDEGYLVQAERWFRKHLSEDPLWEIRFAATQEWFNDKFRGYENPKEHEQELKDRTKEQLNVAWAWLWSRPEGDVGRAPTSQEQGQGGSAMFTLLSWFLLCPLYVFFFLLQIDAIIATSREYMPGRARPTIERLFGEIDETLSAFFRGRLMICLLKGSLTAVGLLIFGVPFWLPLGLAAGFLALIPYVGVYLALIPALFLCWFEHHSWMLMAGTLGAFGSAELLEGLVLIPVFLGKEVGLHPLTIIVTLLIFGKIFGFIGVLLSVPLAAISKILGREFVLPLVREFAEEEVGESAKKPRSRKAKKAAT